ncbi:hypothetical protein RRG08_064989 [Elysia crispata]|uniref:Uncharacterized protein n=1 Tax=Elysia crispata TaxID=231223 RepID=A0AAE0YA35_9GAST|nr:hypothetical protein RRG08_064989 [Elysia crispata]
MESNRCNNSSWLPGYPRQYHLRVGERAGLLSLCLSTSPLHDCDLVYDAIDPATDVELQVAIETDGRLNM